MSSTAVMLSGAVVSRRLDSSRRLALMAALLVAAFTLSVSLGARSIPPAELLGILSGAPGHEGAAAVLFGIRLPRALFSVLAGAALGVSGAGVQALFRNPLADPALIGVSSGAALFACLAIVFSGSAAAGSPIPLLGLPAAAFAGGIVASYAVWRIAAREGAADTTTLLLAGIGVNALASAGIGLLLLIASDVQIRTIAFWNLGSLGGVTWASFAVVTAFSLPLFVFAPIAARSLDALLLGESEARHLGVSVERLKRGVIVAAALAVGSAVAFAGAISFVGLVAPHLARLLLGPGHVRTIPGAALAGGIALTLADLLARTVVAPSEIPLGVVTAGAGAPFFLWLLRRSSGRGLA